MSSDSGLFLFKVDGCGRRDCLSPVFLADSGALCVYGMNASMYCINVAK